MEGGMSVIGWIILGLIAGFIGSKMRWAAAVAMLASVHDATSYTIEAGVEKSRSRRVAI
jgi:hypothetical protein